MKKAKNPLVVIQCLVYNQEKYIRDCLDGFVMQQTDFPFVAVVHDDASSDNSASIIREYAEKYPDIILPIYETENQWSKGDGTFAKIIHNAISSTGAKYVSMCEGDDYWTDPYKLQKQVNFLENNIEFTICFHPVMVLNQLTGEIVPDTLKEVPSETTIYDLTGENYIHTPSVMYRYSTEVDDKFLKVGRVGVGDYLYHLLYAERGKIKKLPDYMAVYRQGVGIWTGANCDGNNNMLLWIIACSKLSSLLEDSKARWLLENQIHTDKNMVLEEIEVYEKQIKQLQSSKAYRIGKMILKPFNFLKRLLLRK